ncbi:hypothetical protein AB0K09_05085 [Streptomyces sp. NPDC049577]|uniref:WXG100 family type VII secretion target n=1 Tax=Streptomyces sp. NPDC049577 TaxID=3155153 RepID=UPI003414E981
MTTDKPKAPRARDPRRPFRFAFITQDFASVPHEKLRAMVEEADSGRVADVGGKLKDASVTIRKLGEDLRQFIAHVSWEGEGAEAFRAWGADTVNATLRLGAYSEKAGTWMEHAATTLRDVQKAMPKYSPEAKALLDSYLNLHPQPMGAAVPNPLAVDADKGLRTEGPSQQQAYAAQKQLHDEHMAAAQQMKRLAESYNDAGLQISRAERPNFPVVPAGIMPPPTSPFREVEYLQPVGSADQQGAGSYRGGSGFSAGAVEAGRHSPGMISTAPDGNRHEFGGSASPHNASLPPRDPGTVIDGTPTLPHAPTTTPSPNTGGQPNGGPADGLSKVIMPPMTGPGTGPMGPVNGGRLPSSARPTIPVGRSGGMAKPVTAVPHVPEPGIIGGRPVAPAPDRSVGRIPRGTVVGAEPVQGQGQSSARSGVAPGVGYGGAAAGPNSNRTGFGPGRRLATEPGGVVGGRPVQRPGASGDKPFTPGGAGLVRGREEVSGATSRRNRDVQRPDYLVEDEETWQHAARRVVPPVID